MRILLDTMYLYRLMEARPQLSDAERMILTNQEVQLHISTASVWEMINFRLVIDRVSPRAPSIPKM